MPPEGWRSVPLGHLTTQLRESVPVVSGEQYRLLGVSGKAKGVFSKAAVDSRTTRATRLYRVKSGQFIYNRLFASTGSFAIVPPELGDSYVSNEFPSFDTDTTRLDAGYLYLTFQQPAVWDRVASECVGSTGSRFRWSEARFAQFEISLPPLAEQRRIVDLFDAVDAAIDAARQQQGAVAEARKALLAEVMQPRESWAETTLGSVGDSWGGGTPSKAEPSYWNGKVPWASPKDFGKPFIPDSKDHISQAAVGARGLRLCPAGAVLIVVRSGILRHRLPVATAGQPMAINQDLKCLSTGDAVTDRWLYHYLVAHEVDFLDRYRKTGTTVESLNFPALLTHRMSMPSRDEQYRVVGLLDALDGVEDGTTQLHDALIETRSNLLADLLSGDQRIPESYDRLLEAV